MDSQDDAIRPRKRLNSFQLIGRWLSAAAGVRGGTNRRDESFVDAGPGAILGAILIFCTLLAMGFYAFVHAVQNAVNS